MASTAMYRPWLAAAAVAGVAAYIIAKLLNHRRAFRQLPGPPHSTFWGHLKVMGEYVGRMPKGAYIHSVITQMKRDFDLPDIYYLDLWPANISFIFLSGPDAAAIPTTVRPMEQAHLVGPALGPTLGKTFIEATNGPLWKELHSQLAPGLTPAMVKKSIGEIIKSAEKLHDTFQTYASSGKVADLAFEMGKYPFEVIAFVLFGEPLSDKLYKDTVQLVECMGEQNSSQPSLNIINNRRMERGIRACLVGIESELEARIRSRYAELQARKGPLDTSKTTPVVDRMLAAQAQTGKPLDDRTLTLVMDNAKGFIAAGYGTTTDTSAYILMLLGAFPEKLKALREEHERVFGKDLDKSIEILNETPGILNKLEYTTAVIYETLRLFPIGFSVRQPPADMKTFDFKGKTYPVPPNTVFAVMSHTMHYDPEIFPEPKIFKPERFLTEDGAEPGYPRNGYRPFERGLRSCMGQTLAMEEMKIMLVLVARWFDVELVGHEPVAKPLFDHTDLDTKLGKHAFTIRKVTSAPLGPIHVKIKPAAEAK